MIIIACDGCGTRLDAGTERGFVDKKRYCETCDATYQEHAKAVDALHDRLAALWAEGLTLLERGFIEKHPKFDLPDLPDPSEA